MILSLLFIFLFHLTQALPRGRGGGGRGGSAGGGAAASVYGNYASTPEYKNSDNYLLYNIPIWGWFLIAIPIMGVVLVCFALAAWKIIVYVTKFDNSNRPRSDPKVLCPLCVKKVKEQNWKHGNHRVKCARKYQAKILNEWPIFDPSMLCPGCGQNLRKITTASRLFKCQLCPSETILIGCFTCDFHMCQNCLNRQRIEAQRRSFVPPKIDFEPSAPAYDLVVNNDNINNHDDNKAEDDEECLPTYEQAIAMIKETQT